MKTVNWIIDETLGLIVLGSLTFPGTPPPSALFGLTGSVYHDSCNGIFHLLDAGTSKVLVLFCHSYMPVFVMSRHRSSPGFDIYAEDPLALKYINKHKISVKLPYKTLRLAACNRIKICYKTAHWLKCLVTLANIKSLLH